MSHQEARSAAQGHEVEGTVPSQWWLDLKVENQRLREALTYYAEGRYPDGGEIAREALAGEKEDAGIEDDVVTLRSALDYPKLGYGYAYREALEALDRLAEAAHASERLREQVNSGRLGRERAEGLSEGMLPRV